jgi:hypothetical protein
MKGNGARIGDELQVGLIDHDILQARQENAVYGR